MTLSDSGQVRRKALFYPGLPYEEGQYDEDQTTSLVSTRYGICDRTLHVVNPRLLDRLDFEHSCRQPERAGRLRKSSGITLCNHSYMAFEAGPLAPFDHDSSITVLCETQAEIESLYDTLKEGASTEQGGILQDRWGLRWKILPRQLGDRVPAPAKTEHVGEDQLHKAKFDIAGLEATAKG